jgi:hypothetical protein
MPEDDWKSRYITELNDHNKTLRDLGDQLVKLNQLYERHVELLTAVAAVIDRVKDREEFSDLVEWLTKAAKGDLY